MNRSKTIWVGRYQEDAIRGGFEGGICQYGVEDAHTRIYNPAKGHMIDFIKESIEELDDKEIFFYFYDPSLIYTLPRNMRERCVFANDKEIYRWLNNKTLSRSWVQQNVKVPPFAVLCGSEISIDKLKSIFRGYGRFVIQEMVSNSGDGTYLYEGNVGFTRNALYIVSPYFETAISINVTVFVSRNDQIILRPSVQIIEKTVGKLQYRGSDFIAANYIPKKYLEEIKEKADKICDLLHFLGYRGICGIDFLLYQDDVYFLELNPRFQGSSFLIEKSANNVGLSILDINEICFSKGFSEEEKATLEILNIPYASHIENGCRLSCECALVSINIDPSETNYYDYFADIYHIMLPDWENSIDTQGEILSALFKKYAKRPVLDVLDCTCGIGIQSISLSLLGYNVTGSDISKNELEQAKDEALRRNLDTKFVYADCRYLKKTIPGFFDTVISIDSALPHLVTRENFVMAFRSIYNMLRPGGLFLSSYRDYSKLLDTKPELAYPIRFKEENGKKYVIFRHWTWDNSIIHSRQYVIEETDVTTHLFTGNYTQWAITQDDLSSIYSEVGFNESYWLSPEESGFTQPILCLVKPSS